MIRASLPPFTSDDFDMMWQDAVGDRRPRSDGFHRYRDGLQDVIALVDDGWIVGCIVMRVADLHGTAGTVLILVPDDCQRMGFGTQLLHEADRVWHIDWSKQAYTKDGAALCRSLLHLQRSETR